MNLVLQRQTLAAFKSTWSRTRMRKTGSAYRPACGLGSSSDCPWGRQAREAIIGRIVERCRRQRPNRCLRGTPKTHNAIAAQCAASRVPIFREKPRPDRAALRAARNRPSVRRTEQYAKRDRKPSSIPNCRARDAAKSSSIPAPARAESRFRLDFESPLSRLSRQYLMHTTTSMKGVTGLLPRVWRARDTAIHFDWRSRKANERKGRPKAAFLYFTRARALTQPPRWRDRPAPSAAPSPP